MRVSILGFLICATIVTGCSRTWYRNSADRDVYDIISYKSSNPEWSLNQVDVAPASRAIDFAGETKRAVDGGANGRVAAHAEEIFLICQRS